MSSELFSRGKSSVAVFFFFQAEDGIRDADVTGVQTCALPIWKRKSKSSCNEPGRSTRKQNRGSSPTMDRSSSPETQGVHSHRGYDARADITLLPAIEWQTGALAQIVKVGVHPTRHTVDEGRCAAPDSNLRGSLQHRTLA